MPSLMDLALAAARQALFITSPNPRVGCVIATSDGQVLGVGHTQQAGGPHAEIMAMRDAAAHGYAVKGATAYVTLEPCSHHGRTGPCCDALASAGIARVVASLPDPNPLVAGNGFARLRAAGIAVEIGLGADESRALNLGFFSRMVRKQPWVRLKAAMSLDGGTALPDGSSQWITSEAARADGHQWRAQACAILTGVGTVLTDDPALDVRYVDTPRQPRLVVVDSQLRTSPSARLFGADRQVIIYCAIAPALQRAALESVGAHVVELPDGQGRVDLTRLLRDLAAREVNELHVEAGGQLNGALLSAGLIDECVLYLAPKLLGHAQTAFNGLKLPSLSAAVALDVRHIETIGQDIRIQAVVQGHDQF